MNPFRTLMIHLKGRRYQGILKTIYRYLQVKQWKYRKKTVTVSLRDQENIQIIMQPGCAVSEKLYVVGLYDHDGMQTLQKLMKPSEVFYDVGANVGPFSLLAHDRGASVYAFEGHPITTQRCRENFKLNGINPDRAFATAVSEHNGKITFTNVVGSSVNKIIDNSKSSKRISTIEVPAITLDSFAVNHEYPTAVKIDTEGSELTVIKGMQVILKNGTLKYLTFEANGLSSREDLREIYDILSNANFILGTIDWKQNIFSKMNDLGIKSPTGDYMAIAKSAIDLFTVNGIKILGS